MFLPNVRFPTFDSRYCHQARNLERRPIADPQPVEASGHASKPDLDRWRTSGAFLSEKCPQTGDDVLVSSARLGVGALSARGSGSWLTHSVPLAFAQRG